MSGSRYIGINITDLLTLRQVKRKVNSWKTARNSNTLIQIVKNGTVENWNIYNYYEHHFGRNYTRCDL